MIQAFTALRLGDGWGVSHRVGPEMAFWILPASRRPISCTTVQRITNLEKEETVWKGKNKSYEDRVNIKLNAKTSDINLPQDLIQEGKLLSLDDEDEDEYDDPVFGLFCDSNRKSVSYERCPARRDTTRELLTVVFVRAASPHRLRGPNAAVKTIFM